MAIELGAQPLNDLTDKVTHLLATEPGSAKYKVRSLHMVYTKAKTPQESSDRPLRCRTNLR